MKRLAGSACFLLARNEVRESGTGALNESKAKPKLEYSAIGLGEDAA